MTTEREAWLEWRRQGIGASDVAAVLGLSRWATPYSKWAEKVGLVDDESVTDAMRHGQYAERVLAPWFTDETGLTVRNAQARCEHRTKGHLRCTPDGFVHEGNGSQPLGIFEGKATSDDPDVWAEKIPEYYRCQVAYACGVTGLSRAWFAVLHTAYGRIRFRTYEYEPSASDIQFLLDAADRFWCDHVVTGVAPEVDGSDVTSDALRAVHPFDDGTTVEAGVHDRELIRRYVDARRALRRAEGYAKAAGNALKRRLADRAAFTIDGEEVVTWRTHERAGYSVEPTTVRTMRLRGANLPEYNIPTMRGTPT